MNIRTRTLLTEAVLLATAAPAIAASPRQDDGSQLAVWVFLGMCALIVILQLVPLMILGLGAIRAFFRERGKKPVEVAVDK